MKKPVKLSNGVYVINCMPHKIVFEDGTEVEPSGYLLLADFEEEVIQEKEHVKICKMKPVPTVGGKIELKKLKQQYPEAIILGSAISAMAYRPDVKMPMSARQRGGRDKVFRIDKFTVYDF